MSIFRTARKARLEDHFKHYDLNAKTLMLLDAVQAMPADKICSVLSASLRDKEGIPAGYMRRLAQDLDRRADELERSE